VIILETNFRRERKIYVTSRNDSRRIKSMIFVQRKESSKKVEQRKWCEGKRQKSNYFLF
jgi:hypothetical protein